MGTGQLKILDGNIDVLSGRMFMSNAGTGKQSMLVLDNDLRQSAIYFDDSDSDRTYILSHRPDGLRFDLVNWNAATSAARIDMSIQTATGNIGMGTTNPQEKLDVDGNIRLTGNIVSPTDICIGNCP